MPNLKDEAVDRALPPQESTDPKTQEIIKKAKGYETVLKQLIHGKKTRDEVINMLAAGGDAYVSVPQAAMTINDMGVQTMKQGGVKVERSVQMVASAYLIDDLMQLGEAAKAFQLEDGMAEAITEDTYQMYIERGLKDKSIDPIQLQMEAQQAMTEEQAAGGLVLGHGKIPNEPNQAAVVEGHVNRRVNERETALAARQAKSQAKQKQSALADQVVQQGQGGQ